MSGFDVSLHNKTLQFMASTVPARDHAGRSHTSHADDGASKDDPTRDAKLHQLMAMPWRALGATALALAFLAHALVLAAAATPVPWCGLAARGVLAVQTAIVFGGIPGGFRTAMVFLAALYEADRDAQQASGVAYAAAAVVIVDSAAGTPPGYGRTILASLALMAIATCVLLRAVVAAPTTAADAVLAVVLVGAHASLATDRHWASRLKSSYTTASRSRT